MPGSMVQTFELKAPGNAQIYMFKFLNNHGNKEATCVYRVNMLGDNFDENVVFM